jgi:hypothetical protein
MKHCWDGPRKLSITWGTNETSISSYIFFLRPHDSVSCLHVGGFMRYKFKVTEDGKPEEEKEEMSFKKLLKSLVTLNPKWTGFMSYENKKGRYVVHSIKNGKRI